MPIDRESAIDDFMTTLNMRRSRRTMLKGALGAAAAATGLGALSSTHAQGFSYVTALPASGATADAGVRSILSIAATAEQLAVTFYTHGINGSLGLTSAELDILKAALIEEQIHHDFFVANGGQPIADTFSFPNGGTTFTDLPTFIATQQQLEGAFDAAFIAAVFQFAEMGEPLLARIACQVAMIESEHRALGRNILNTHTPGSATPPDNWTFAPALLDTVQQAPGVLASAGYLSPTSGNSYTYIPTNYGDPAISSVYANVTNRAPTDKNA